MRLQSILVATDLSLAAEPVYRWAAALAGRFGSRVTLINIDETSQFEWPAGTLQSAVRLKQLLPVRRHHREGGEAFSGAGARLPGALPRTPLRPGPGRGLSDGNVHGADETTGIARRPRRTHDKPDKAACGGR